MVKIYVSKKLEKEITKRLSKKDADNAFIHIYSLKENPYKGDFITAVGNIVIKELKHGKFRFYFLHSNKLLKLITHEELENEIIRFTEMSDKSKEQQRVIERIKKDIRRSI